MRRSVGGERLYASAVVFEDVVEGSDDEHVGVYEEEFFVLVLFEFSEFRHDALPLLPRVDQFWVDYFFDFDDDGTVFFQASALLWGDGGTDDDERDGFCGAGGGGVHELVAEDSGC